MADPTCDKSRQDCLLELARAISAAIEVSVYGPSGSETPPCAEAWSTAKWISELLLRVEALETAAKPAESTRQEMLDSSLVDRVTAVIADPDGPEELWHDDARAAILEIAAWVDRLGYHSCAAELRKEVPQPCCEPS